MTPGCQRRSWISKILLTYFIGCRKQLKNAFFHMFFTRWPHVFDRCAKTVCARRNPKTKCVIYDELFFSQYNTDYCGASSSSDHRVRKLIKFLKSVFSFNGNVMVISRRGDVCDVTSGATYSLLGVFFFFLSFFFYSSSNLSRYSSDLRDFYYETRVMPRSFERRRRIRNILRTFFTGCKKPLKTAFSRFFRWVTSRFRPLRKNGLARRKTKTV